MPCIHRLHGLSKRLIRPTIQCKVRQKKDGKKDQLMEYSLVTSKGQMVIPSRIRRKYGIKPGTKVCLIERENEIVLQPVTRQFIRSVGGMLKSDTSATQELLSERAKDRKREEGRIEKLRSR